MIGLNPGPAGIDGQLRAAERFNQPLGGKQKIGADRICGRQQNGKNGKEGKLISLTQFGVNLIKTIAARGKGVGLDSL